MILFWASLFLFVAAEPVPFKQRDYTVEIKEELKSLLKDLALALRNKDNVSGAYKLLLKRYQHVQSMPNFDWLRHSSRSTRFILARIDYRMQSMKVRLQNPDADSSSSVNISEKKVVHLVRELFIAVRNVSDVINHSPKLGYNAALTVVDTYKLLQQALLLDDRERTEHEKNHIEVLILVYKHMGLRLNDDYPEIMIEKSLTASEAQLDAGRELEGEDLQLFVNSLSQIEKEIVNAIGMITVVTFEHVCYVYSRIGKWYLQTYVCTF